MLSAYDALAAHPSVDSSAIALVGTGWELPKLQLHHEQDLRTYRRKFVAAATNRALRACSVFKGDVLLGREGKERPAPR